jgi:hypothetical protein
LRANGSLTVSLTQCGGCGRHTAVLGLYLPPSLRCRLLKEKGLGSIYRGTGGIAARGEGVGGCTFAEDDGLSWGC